MEVTSHNLEHALDELNELVDDYTFISIDLEFSGLGKHRPSNLDTPTMRYDAARRTAQSYPPLQFGLTLFRPLDPDQNVNPDVQSEDVGVPVSMDDTQSQEPERKTDASENVPAKPQAEGEAQDVQSMECETKEEARCSLLVETNTVSSVLEKLEHDKNTGENGRAKPQLESEANDAQQMQCDTKEEAQCSLPVETNEEAEPNAQSTLPAMKESTPAYPKRVNWEARPYNFVLFPRAFYPGRRNRPTHDRILQLQASTVEFLNTAGFDWQKCFTEGISWLKKSEEDNIREEQLATYRPIPKQLKPRDKSQRIVIASIMTQIKAWVHEVKNKRGETKKFPNDLGDVKPVLLVSAVERELPTVYLKFLERVPRLAMSACIMAEVMENGVPKEMHEKDRKDHFKRMVERNVLENAGFRRVIDLLLEKRKPVVVHHGLLDLTKLVANFIAPIPERLSGFKRQLVQRFPLIWDTRVILANLANQSEFLADLLTSEQGRSIEGIIEKISNFASPESVANVVVANGDEWDEDYPGKAHEAGYDALQAGRLMLLLVGLEMKKPLSEEHISKLPEHEFFKTLKNRIFLGSCGGFSDVHLECTAPEDADEAAERKVEDDRNALMSRSNVVVFKGIKWDAMKDDSADIPYIILEKAVNSVLSSTAFSTKKSKVMPCAGGHALVTLKRKHVQQQPPTKKRKLSHPTENGTHPPATSSSPTNCETASSKPISVVDKESDETEVSEEEMERLVKLAEENGIEVVPYREQLLSESNRFIRLLT